MSYDQYRLFKKKFAYFFVIFVILKLNSKNLIKFKLHHNYMHTYLYNNR